MSLKKEAIIAVHLSQLPLALSEAQGFVPESEEVNLDAIFANSWFGPRYLLENNKDNPDATRGLGFVHPATYCPVMRLNAEGTGLDILVYNRPGNNAIGEQALAGKASVGFGGHPTVQDLVFGQDPNSEVGEEDEEDLDASDFIDGTQTVINALERELSEELDPLLEIDESNCLSLGYIRDTTDEVGKAHFAVCVGVMYDYEESPDPDNTEVLNARWVALEDAAAIENYENWSTIIVQFLIENKDSIFQAMTFDPEEDEEESENEPAVVH